MPLCRFVDLNSQMLPRATPPQIPLTNRRKPVAPVEHRRCTDIAHRHQALPPIAHMIVLIRIDRHAGRLHRLLQFAVLLLLHDRRGGSGNFRILHNRGKKKRSAQLSFVWGLLTVTNTHTLTFSALSVSCDSPRLLYTTRNTISPKKPPSVAAMRTPVITSYVA